MFLEMAADGLGSRVAFGSRDGGLSYAALRDAATGVAAHLAPAPRTVAVLSETAPLVPVALFGAAWGGVSYAPLNYRLPDEARESSSTASRRPSSRSPPGSTCPPTAAGRSSTRRPRRRCCCSRAARARAPKAARLGHDQLTAYVFNTVEFGVAEEQEAVLVAVPPFHIAGVAAVLSSTYAGRRIVPLPRFDPDDVARPRAP